MRAEIKRPAVRANVLIATIVVLSAALAAVAFSTVGESRARPIYMVGVTDPIAYGTFRTTGLLVDSEATIGTSAAPLTPVLTLRTGGASTVPLEFAGVVTNTWDMSPITGSNVDPATITMFALTPTTTPSVDGTLNLHLIAGTGGAGGVDLSPNGASYLDPDGYAQHGHILAIGFLAPQYVLDVRDPGNAHTTLADCVANTGSAYECGQISAKGTSTYATGAGSNTIAFAVNGEALNTKASGIASLINIGLHGRAGGGDANWSLLTEDGDVCEGCTGSGAAAASGNVFVKRPLIVSSTSATFTGGGTIISGTSPYTLSVGPESDDTYFVNGNIAYGYNVNADDHLNFNFGGYLFGASRYRSENHYDGKNNLMLLIDAPNHQVLFSDGSINTTVVRLIDGHEITNGVAPGINASCTSGAGASIAGTDKAFKLVTGTTSTSCTITFHTTYVVAPVCVITAEAGKVLPTYTISATAITMTTDLNAVYNAVCFGTAGAS